MSEQVIEIKSFNVVELQPGDKIVAHCEQRLSNADVVQLKTQIGARFPDREIIIVDGGLRLSVVRDG